MRGMQAAEFGQDFGVQRKYFSGVEQKRVS
jgi:hypothetical protein